jgi:hypothetical protein
MNGRRVVLSSIEGEYRRYKALGGRAMDQVADADLVTVPAADSNSIAMIVWHLAGNLTSRFTDFLTTDGEKPWRNRESEFVVRDATRAQTMARWDEGWKVLFASLQTLDDDSLARRVTIRGDELTVLEALHRSLAHASYHVGQIVQLAKSYRGAEWQSLSIPKGGLRATPVKNALSADDRRFRGDFEAGTIPAAQFDHRSHVRLAYTYLAEHDVETATTQMRTALLGFLKHHGINPSKYHETMTRAWILAVRHFMETAHPSTSADIFIDANPRLLDAKIMMTHYSAGLLFSPQARSEFVEPDLGPIPRHDR